ncbi:hypothetical protein X551_03858 [Methylibium sp. T29]|nr:hypothetical protein X551_03858 [Methylibium sp. T29]
MARDRVPQQRHQHLRVGRDELEVGQRQLGRRGRLGEHRHQVARTLVLAHQHRRQLLADLHQVSQVGDVVLGDQVLDHADALEPRAGAQGFGQLALVDLRHLRDRRVGLLRTRHLELDEQTAQVALVARQRAVQQQRALGRVELQQTGQRIDVLLHQRRFLLDAALQPLGGGAQHGQQVLGRVLHVLVDVEEQRAFLVGPAPRAVAGDEGEVAQRRVALPGFVRLDALAEVIAQPAQHAGRPHQVTAGQRQQRAPVAPQVEAPEVTQRQREDELRAQPVEHGRIRQAGRQHVTGVSSTPCHGPFSTTKTPCGPSWPRAPVRASPATGVRANAKPLHRQARVGSALSVRTPSSGSCAPSPGWRACVSPRARRSCAAGDAGCAGRSTPAGRRARGAR